ncbi:glucose-methanol-choline oxidoreductase [Sphingobium lactosutens]|uniref:GMC family oxidoreductase n=1 Tax=Sphingobium lactosutens TaxID=522773 RepID=UPI0015B7FCA6|nr:GMC family oxidoreductase N-terminal domain-containing protein [Sphingobium lactosutens]NWK95788.1 glucose-methanol-choline oxidoreductase [Sphingobium lactosutens]
MSDYDYIVIGSGSAGSLMANRLSADPANRVALIEAGPSDRNWPVNVKTAMPVGNIFLLPHEKYNWKQSLAGNEAVNNRQINFPRGKLFGGCSAINGGVYIRGQKADYDAWADAGNAGWAHDDVLPAFKAVENYHGPDQPWHGKGGELDVEKPKSWNPIATAIVDAAAQAGHHRNTDFAGERQDGFGRYDLNQRNGTRLSSARAFLHPALHRENLTVLDETMVRRILFDRGRASGIEIEKDSARRILTARREIILCAGATNSPQLLMLSGIGPQDHLRDMGIDLIHHLPGVGQHLQDHPTVHVAMENPSGESYAISPKALPRILASPFRYLFNRTGMLASNVAECGGFLCTDGSGRPDIQITFLVGLKIDARSVPRRHGYMALIQLLRPKSAGSVRLATNRPEDKPVIDPNFFADPYDMKTLIAGFREARNIFAQPSLAAMTGAEIEPGAQHQSDAEIDAALRQIVNTAYHPTGTAKMGPDSDPMAVVDNRLRVRGVAGLRVVDASVMPEIISGNTSAPTMMIAERAARFILEDALRSNIAA